MFNDYKFLHNVLNEYLGKYAVLEWEFLHTITLAEPENLRLSDEPKALVASYKCGFLNFTLDLDPPQGRIRMLRTASHGYFASWNQEIYINLADPDGFNKVQACFDESETMRRHLRCQDARKQLSTSTNTTSNSTPSTAETDLSSLSNKVTRILMQSESKS